MGNPLRTASLDPPLVYRNEGVFAAYAVTRLTEKALDASELYMNIIYT
jgi:hypothetical protein